MIKKKALIISSYFSPAFKAGGPVRSLRNMLDANIFQKYELITSNRDYDGLLLNNIDMQIVKEKYSVKYLNRIKFLFSFLINIVEFKKFNKLYINGFFHPYYISYFVFFLLFTKSDTHKIIISPRGSLGEKELALGSSIKNYYLFFLSFLIKHKKNRKIFFHLTSPREVEDVKRLFPYSHIKTVLLENFIGNTSQFKFPEDSHHDNKKVIYISRITPKKNLNISYDIFHKTHHEFDFSVAGPYENKDKQYADKVLSNIKSIKKINFHYHGSIPHEDISTELSKHDIFFLPTIGENFGHAIVEAMLAGLIIVISDKTPWNFLSDKNFVWIVKDNDIDIYKKVFDQLFSLTSEQIFELKRDSFIFFNNHFNEFNKSLEKEYSKLF